jgi:hypothetical protein
LPATFLGAEPVGSGNIAGVHAGFGEALKNFSIVDASAIGGDQIQRNFEASSLASRIWIEPNHR